MYELEDLIIYRKYLDLIAYSEDILLKYPKSERFGITREIKKAIYGGMRHIIKAQKTFQKHKRLEILNQFDVELKILKVMIRISYNKQYINDEVYMVWSRLLTDQSNLLGAWISSCLKQKES